MIVATLIVLFTLAGLIGLGALIMALAQDMARGSESYPLPITHIFVQDWSDFAGEHDAEPRAARRDAPSADVPSIFPLRTNAAGGSIGSGARQSRKPGPNSPAFAERRAHESD